MEGTKLRSFKVLYGMEPETAYNRTLLEVAADKIEKKLAIEELVPPKVLNVCGLLARTTWISTIVILLAMISTAIRVGIGVGAETSRFLSKAYSVSASGNIPASAK